MATNKHLMWAFLNRWQSWS